MCDISVLAVEVQTDYNGKCNFANNGFALTLQLGLLFFYFGGSECIYSLNVIVKCFRNSRR